jgi:hypothetical protein
MLDTPQKNINISIKEMETGNALKRKIKGGEYSKIAAN